MQSSPGLFTRFQVPLSSPGSLITQLFPRRGHCGDFGAACDQSQLRQGAGCWLLAPTDARAVRDGGTTLLGTADAEIKASVCWEPSYTRLPPSPVRACFGLSQPSRCAGEGRAHCFRSERGGVGRVGSVKGNQCTENNRKQKAPNTQKVKNADFNRTTQNVQTDVRRKPD